MATSKFPPFYFVKTWLVASMGNLIFGYELGLAGIALSMPHFDTRASTPNPSSSVCKLERATPMTFLCSLYFGALLASLGANYVTRWLGSRLSVFVAGILFCLGAVINASAVHLVMLLLGRTLIGFGVGIYNQAAPLYLAEMAPRELREDLKIGSQFWIMLGTLLAGVMNFLSAKIKGWGWRLSLGCAMIPSLIMTIGFFYLPDTPKSLIELGKMEEAGKVLRRLWDRENVEEELNDLEVSREAAPNAVLHPWSKDLWQRKNIPHIIVAVFIAIFQQLTGISVIMFYTPMLFMSIGLNHNAAILWPVINLQVVFGATLLCWCASYYMGRKLLILQGCLQIFVCLLVLYILANLGSPEKRGNPTRWHSIVSFVVNSIYAASFARSWGPIGWLVPSEMYPVEIRSAAQTISVSVNMLFTFFIVLISPFMLCHFMSGLYAIFAIFAFFMAIFIFYLLPDTTGIPIEKMSQVWEKHRVWGRFILDENVPSEPSKAANVADVTFDTNISNTTDRDMSDTSTDTDISNTTADSEKGECIPCNNIRPETKGVAIDISDSISDMTDTDTSDTTTNTDISDTTTDTDISDTTTDIEMGEHIPYNNIPHETKDVAVDVSDTGTDTDISDTTTDIERGEHTTDDGLLSAADVVGFN